MCPFGLRGELVDEVADAVRNIDGQMPGVVHDVRGLAGRGHDVEDEEDHDGARDDELHGASSVLCGHARTAHLERLHTARIIHTVGTDRHADDAPTWWWAMRRREPCAGGIVHDGDGRLLVVRRGRPPSAGRWSVPGGRCRPGEPAADACVREVAEETGLT